MAAEVSKARIAAEAVQGGDAVFGIECKTIGQRSQSTACHPRCALYDLVIDLEARTRAQRARVSIKSAMAKALGYSLRA
jgi:hypothetical protein